MEDYEAKKFVIRSENVTVGQLLDMWVEEELKPGTLSNGTVMLYQREHQPDQAVSHCGPKAEERHPGASAALL